MKIQFTVTNQHIEAKAPSKIVADSKNYLEASFFFVTGEWEDVQKSVVFSNQLGTYTVILDGNTCFVPWECIIAGDLSVSVFGGDRITTDVAKVRIFPSGYKLGETPRDPTPDVYAEILDRLKTIQGGTVSEADIKAAVADYLTKHPIETLTEGDVSDIIEQYFVDNPVDTLTGQQVKDIIDASINALPQPETPDVAAAVGSYVTENKDTLFPADKDKLTVLKGKITSADSFSIDENCYIFKNVTFPDTVMKFYGDVVWVKKYGTYIELRTLDFRRFYMDVAFSNGNLLSNFRETSFYKVRKTSIGSDTENYGSFTLPFNEIYKMQEAGASVSVHIVVPGDVHDDDLVYTLVFKAKSNEETPLFYLGEDDSNQLIPRIFGSIVAGQVYRAEYHTSDGVLRIM